MAGGDHGPRSPGLWTRNTPSTASTAWRPGCYTATLRYRIVRRPAGWGHTARLTIESENGRIGNGFASTSTVLRKRSSTRPNEVALGRAGLRHGPAIMGAPEACPEMMVVVDLARPQ